MSSRTKPDEAISMAPDGLTRRTILKYLGAAFATAALPEALSSCGPSVEEGGETFFGGPDEADLVISSKIEVVRPEDLLVLTFGLSNLRKDASNRLVRTTNAASYLVVDFPSQVIVESATPKPSGAPAPAPTAPLKSKLGGPSRLVFRLPPDFTGVDFTLAALLDLCSKSDLVLPERRTQTLMRRTQERDLREGEPLGTPELPALAAGAIDHALAPVDEGAAVRVLRTTHRAIPAIVDAAIRVGTTSSALAAPPDVAKDGVTYIEMPYRLLLAPNSLAAWAHSPAPVASPSGRIELWHTRLGTRDALTGGVDERNAALRTAVAIATRDTQVPGDPNYVDNPSLTPRERQKLVELSATSPIRINRMWLSALGGSLDARGEWSDPEVRSWVHKIGMGRETFVQVVKTGYLLPFGNPTVCIKITKRNENPKEGPVGLLLQWFVYVIAQPVSSYRDYGPDGQRVLREFPFVDVELKRTLIVTSSPPPQPLTPGGPVPGYYVRDDAGRPVMLPAVGYDRRGRAARFQVGTFFYVGEPSGAFAYVGTSPASPAGGFLPIDVPMDGQRIAFAASQLDDTTYETKRFQLYVKRVESETTRFPVVPYVYQVDLAVEAVRQLVGTPNEIYEFHPHYKASGLDPVGNPAQMLFSCAAGAKPIKFTKNDGSTGFVRPNMMFSGLSRTTGPAMDFTSGASLVAPRGAGSTSLVAPAPPSSALAPIPQFDPEKLFDKALEGTKLFGVFPLTQIVKPVTSALIGDKGIDGFVNDAMRYAPKFITEAYHEAERIIAAVRAFVDRVGTVYEQMKEMAEKLEQEPKKAEAQIRALIDEAKRRAEAVRTAAEAAYEAARTVEEDIVAGGSRFQALTGLPALPAGQVSDAANLVAKVHALLDAIDHLGDLDPTGTLSRELATPIKVVDGVKKELDQKAALVNGYLEDAQRILDLLRTAQQGVEMIRDMKIKLEWRPKIKPLVIFYPESEHGLYLGLEIRSKDEPGKPAGTDLTCRLDRFALRFGGKDDDEAFLSLKFNHLQFKREAGKKPDVDVVFRGIVFGGPLKFIESLRQLIPLDGFSDPPFLDITVEGVRAGFTASVPNVAVGMFSLENIKISAELKVPFLADSPLSFTFSFCDRDHPFLVTVAMLGGGGYFKIVVGAQGPELIEMSLNVAAQLAIDLFVAAASVSISLGIYLNMRKDGATGSMDIEIGGFLRLHGQLDVLGLITISVDLRIDLSYKNGKLVARAVIHVEIDILFFSTSLDIPFERKFAGSNGDPTLRELMEPFTAMGADGVVREVRPWEDYCLAFV